MSPTDPGRYALATLHAGHGDPRWWESAWHTLVEPAHSVPLVAAAALLAVWVVLRRRARTSRR